MFMNKPLYTYSFIIPHHNSPELLNRCLDSIPQREDIQIIVVDDNSAEDKRPCIKRDDVEVIYIDAEQTKGAGRARNYGLKAAKGKWLLFADCDDFYSDNILNILDDHCNKDIDVLFFNCKYVDTNTLEPAGYLDIKDYIDKFDGTDERLIPLKYMNNVPWSKMVKKSFVDKYHFGFEEVVNGNDYLFSVLIGHFMRKYCVDKRCAYFYTLNSDSITNKKNVTEEACLSRLLYCLKRKSLYNYIDIDTIDNSLFYHLARTLVKRGVKEFVLNIKVLFKNWSFICQHKHDYVKCINTVCDSKQMNSPISV